jgi:hypothetical protein
VEFYDEREERQQQLEAQIAALTAQVEELTRPGPALEPADERPAAPPGPNEAASAAMLAQLQAIDPNDKYGAIKAEEIARAYNASMEAGGPASIDVEAETRAYNDRVAALLAESPNDPALGDTINELHREFLARTRAYGA